MHKLAEREAIEVIKIQSLTAFTLPDLFIYVSLGFCAHLHMKVCPFLSFQIDSDFLWQVFFQYS